MTDHATTTQSPAPPAPPPPPPAPPAVKRREAPKAIRMMVMPKTIKLTAEQLTEETSTDTVLGITTGQVGNWLLTHPEGHKIILEPQVFADFFKVVGAVR